MNKSLIWLFGLLALLWLFLGSFFQNRYCNCGNTASVPPIVVPGAAGGGAVKSILISDAEKGFKSGTADNLLFAANACDYSTPLSDALTKVYQETADHLKNNPQRLLVLTGLRQGMENNECAGVKDLGFGRADKVKQLLLGMGAPSAQIRVQSDVQDLPSFEGKLLGGVLYEFISGDIGEVEKRLRVGNITLYFDSNQKEINLTPDQQKYFEDLKYFLAQKPDAKISVAGHTDNKSNLKYNLRLSRKRAEFVRDYMISNGIPKNNIEPVGLGPNKPIGTNDTEEGRAKNRRVEVKIQ